MRHPSNQCAFESFDMLDDAALGGAHDLAELRGARDLD
jgi:hypothetical protein